MTDQEFSIQDLCDQTGLPRRTIHFYIQQDILPPPISSGLGARYQRVHLVRLSLIPILRQQGLRLDDIRIKFNAASLQELENLWSLAEKNHFISSGNLKPATVPSPATIPQPYRLFKLPQGVIVMVPEQLSHAIQQKIEDLCRNIESEMAEGLLKK